MIKIHPAIVHFPIAFLALAGLLAIISLFTKREILKEWVFKSLIAGLIFLPVAIIAGLIEENQLKHSEEIHAVLTIHKFNGFAILLLYLILAIWFWKRKKSMENTGYVVWVFFLFIGTILITYQGYLGGKMVFELGAGVKPMEEFMKDDHDHGSKTNTSTTHEHDLEEDPGDHSEHDTISDSHDHAVKEPDKDSKDQSNADTLKKKKLKDMKY